MPDVSAVRSILERIRRVRTGDLIQPEDHNDQTDAIRALTDVVELMDYIDLRGLTENPPLMSGRLWFRGDTQELDFSPDGSSVINLVGPRDYIDLRGLTEDPPLRAGRLWFRIDTGELRYSPDGVRALIIDPVPEGPSPDEYWEDTQSHYARRVLRPGDPPPVLLNDAVISLDAPAPGQKMVYEDLPTHARHVNGWFWRRDLIMPAGFEVRLKIGAYHALGDTRANVCLFVRHPSWFDIPPDSSGDPNEYALLMMLWYMSDLGYPNGTFNNPLKGWIRLSPELGWSFRPSNPSLLHITHPPYEMVGRLRNILYGYHDNWDEDYDQYASLRAGGSFRELNGVIESANVPPDPEFKIEVVTDITRDLPVDEATIEKRGQSTVLHIRKDKQVVFLTLGDNVQVLEKRDEERSVSPNQFDKYVLDGKIPMQRRRLKVIKLKTDISDLRKKSSTWMLYVVTGPDERLWLFYGDSKWDGDRFAYRTFWL